MQVHLLFVSQSLTFILQTHLEVYNLPFMRMYEEKRYAGSKYCCNIACDLQPHFVL